MFVVETYGHASAMYQADLSAANLPAKLGDVAHGGSAATLTLKQVVVNNTTGIAVDIDGTTGGMTVNASGGHAFSAEATGGSNSGFRGIGAGSGAGMYLQGGNSDGSGLAAAGLGTGGAGIYAQGSPTNGHGLWANGGGTGSGLLAKGGATGIGLQCVGGDTSGDAIDCSTTNGQGMDAVGGRVLARTTIATLTSQTSFTLTAGSTDNDAYNHAIIVVQDANSQIQKCQGVIADYTGSTKTVALVRDPAVFAMAVGDIVTIMAADSEAVWDELRANHTASGTFGLDMAGVASQIETGVTLKQALRRMASVLAGITTGAGTGTEIFQAADGTATRVTVTVDAATGNRTGVAYSDV